MALSEAWSQPCLRSMGHSALLYPRSRLGSWVAAPRYDTIMDGSNLHRDPTETAKTILLPFGNSSGRRRFNQYWKMAVDCKMGLLYDNYGT